MNNGTKGGLGNSLSSSFNNYSSLNTEGRGAILGENGSGLDESGINSDSFEMDHLVGNLKGTIRKLMIKTDINAKAIHKLKQIREVENARINLYRSKMNYLLENYMAEALY